MTNTYQNGIYLKHFGEFCSKINNFKDDSDIDEFIIGRLNYLEQVTRDVTISYNSVHEGYISSDSVINTDYGNLVINDPRIYKEFALEVRNEKVDNNFLKLSILMQMFIDSKMARNNKEEERIRTYEDLTSISKFYNHNAKSIEKAALVQNLLAFCAIDSVFILGQLKEEEVEKEYAYNILRLSQNNYLVDVDDPIEALTSSGDKRLRPAINSLKPFSIFNQKQSFVFDYDQIRKIFNDATIVNPKKREYYIINQLTKTYN